MTFLKLKKCNEEILFTCHNFTFFITRTVWKMAHDHAFKCQVNRCDFTDVI